MMNWPAGKLETKFGKFEYARTEAKHVSISSNECVVRGVEYKVHVHLYSIDGKWVAPNYHDVSVNRRDIKDASTPARKSVQAEVIAVWEKFAEANPGQGREAQRVHVEDNIERKAGEIKELEAKLKVARKELAELEKELKAV